MFKLVFRIVLRKLLVFVKFFGRHKRLFLIVPLVLSVLFLWPTIWWFAEESSRSLLPPPPPDQALHHYRKNRSLEHYLTNIQVLIEPSSLPCGSLDEVPVMVLVTSAPPRFEHRQAVRETWAKHQPTYFVLGLYGDDIDEQLVDSYIEAKQYSDLIVFDFHDHYQNLTLKTALMMKWTLDHCPQAQFMFKTDDDVMVNPWTLRKVLKENVDAQLLGYSINNTYLHRDDYNKWFVPRWMHYEDMIPCYLSGTGYLINGDYLEKILQKAYQVPMINLEDVYFTYVVSQRVLSLRVTHERRLSPYKPWLKVPCVYWDLASVHSLGPQEMVTAWSKVESMRDQDNNTSACWVYKYFSEYRELALY